MEEEINRVGDMEIRVRNRIFPGVSLRLGKHRLTFEEAHSAARFRLVGDEILEELL